MTGTRLPSRSMQGLCLLVVAAAALAACSERRSVSTNPGPPDVATAALALGTFHWDSIVTRDFSIYVPRGTYASTQVQAYQHSIAEAIAHDLAMLAEAQMPGHLRVFYVGSRSEMKLVAGGRYSGYADAPANAVVLVAARDARPVHRHEIMHVLSLGSWGHPGTNAGGNALPSLEKWRTGSWLREGIAAAAENLCGDFTYRGVVAQMLAEQQLFSFDTLRTAFLQQDDLAAYLQAGTLVNYLLETYGRQKFRELWRSGGTDVQRVYGEDAATIESHWREWLAATTDARPVSVAALRRQTCAPK